MACKLSSDTGLRNLIENVEDNQSTLINNGFENQSIENILGDQSYNVANEDAFDVLHDKNEDSSVENNSGEYGQEKLDISETDEEFNYSALASLSLNVNDSELDLLNHSTSDDEEVEKADQSLVSDTKEERKEPESELHCPICKGYFCCPKFLDCLHTCCESCLLKRVKNSHKFLFCPVCKTRSDIPKGGITFLTDNVVVASLVSARIEEVQIVECIVCKLHDEVKASTGQCLDCGDMMCQDCCEKHTYSRLTAKHKVVTLEEMKSEKYMYTRLHREFKVVNCKHHSQERAEFFCGNCSIPVCRECTISGHRSHLCEALGDAVARKKEAMKEKLELLKEDSDVKLVDDTNESGSLIMEFETNEFKKMKDAKDKMISVIEQKYKHCADQLQRDFDIKRRKYCKHNRDFIHSQREKVDTLSEKIDFILREGSDVETAMLEKFITSAVEQKRHHLSKVRPKLTRKSTFPSVYIHKEHLNVLEGLTFFSTGSAMRTQREEGKKVQHANAEMRVENAEIRMRIGKNFQMATNDVPEDTNVKSLLSLAFADTRVPVGRGMAFQSMANSRSSLQGNQGNRPSLLGEYPAQNLMSEYQDTFSNSSSQSSGMTKTYGNYNNRKDDMIPMMGRPMFRLNLLTSIDIQINADHRMPDISDITFMSYMNFAVADARNHRLKIFTVSGKFVRYIDDPGPTSVTFCAKHLIWSSQFTSIRLYNIHQQKIVRVQRVPQTADHPLTSFNNVKYLIGNVDHYRVEACNIDGSYSHVMQPRDRDGRVLQNISHIAAHSSDQLVCIDQQMGKVVVTDFDGNFAGEFSHEDFEPGGVCITERDDIFVTDKRRNKLILLNSRAEFISDWNTPVHSPSSVASNKTGRVIVAGNGKTVSLYKYAYE